MAKEKIEETAPKTNLKGAFLRKKISVEIRKTADMKTGEILKGKFVTRGERPWTQVDKETGETVEKHIPQFTFEDDKGVRFLVLADQGFANAMTNAAVSNGDVLEIVKLEMKDMGGGRRVNQYDIFQMLPETENN